MFIRKIENKILEVSHKKIEHPSRSVYFNHIHNQCELLLFVSGEAEYNIDGKIFKPSPYDLIFVPGGVYHYLIPTSHITYENYVIGINPETIPSHHYSKLFSPPFVINIKEDTELKNFFSRLDFYDSAYTDEDFSSSSLALIEELITYLYYRKDTLSSPQSSKLEKIDNIIKYISKNIEQPLNADIISRHFLLSKSYVQNMFSQNMHIGLKEYIMQKKIYSARADITAGMSPIEVCEKYSFGDYSSFYRLYKKTFSKSPRE